MEEVTCRFKLNGCFLFLVGKIIKQIFWMSVTHFVIFNLQSNLNSFNMSYFYYTTADYLITHIGGTKQGKGCDGEEGGGGGRTVFSYKETQRENIMGL